MDLGFIILRHVITQETNLYWKKCYECIRKLYPNNKIVIIDDNSNYKLIDNSHLYNTIIINSKSEMCGEILPYYFYIKNKWFEKAVVLHDSVFITEYIDFSFEKYKLLWDFSHLFDNNNLELELIDKLDNNTEVKLYYNDKTSWKGCFGGMCCIDYDYLTDMNNRYNLLNFAKNINNRISRQAWERILGCLLSLNSNIYNNVLLGDINNYGKFGYTYQEYINEIPNLVQPYQINAVNENNKYKIYNPQPLVKVWTLR